MTEYLYDNLSKPVCIRYVRDYIAASSMTNKDILDLSSHPVALWFKVWFSVDLSTGDKTILDSIIASGVGKVQVKEKSDTIISKIFKAAEPITQLPRLLDMFDISLTFSRALDAFNYPVAKLRIEKLLAEGKILQEDRDLVIGFIPDNYVSV